MMEETAELKKKGEKRDVVSVRKKNPYALLCIINQQRRIQIRIKKGKEKRHTQNSLTCLQHLDCS